MIHAVKQLPEFFEAVIEGIKTFEVRQNDRDYRVGDLLALNEYDGKGYTGRCCLVKIDYILNDEKYCRDGFVTMGIKPCYVKLCDGYSLDHNMNPFAVPFVEKSPLRRFDNGREQD